MSEKGVAAELDENSGNSALDWEIFDILCRDELGLDVSVKFYFIFLHEKVHSHFNLTN